MNEGSAEQLQVEERVPRAPSKTVPLNLTKLQQLSTYLVKDVTSCDVQEANPRWTGPFSMSPPTLVTPKIIFPGGSVFYGKEAEGRLRAASPSGTF